MREKPLIIVSYVPMLYVDSVATKRQRRQVLEQARELATLRCRAKACLWSWGDSSSDPHPIFVLDGGTAIFKHLVWWCHDRPGEFFQFGLHYDKSGWYTCALMPDLTKLATRLPFDAREFGVFEDQLIWSPITFDSPKNSLYTTCHPIVGLDKISIGFIDSALINLNNIKPGKLIYDPDDVKWIEVPTTSKAGQYLTTLHDNDGRPVIEPKAWYQNGSKVSQLLK